jgi:transcriptional regulator with XRE-family HTH domain
MEKLRCFMDTHGINAREFAEMAGVSPATISRLLHGKSPTVDNAIKIENATGGFVSVKDWGRPIGSMAAE